MKVQNVLETYKHLPASGLQVVKTGFIVKGENAIIHIVPNLKREIMMQVGDSFQTGFTFYEKSSLAEYHHNNAKVLFNANDYDFLKQYNSSQLRSKKDNLLATSNLSMSKKIKEKTCKQNKIRVAKDDRFKDLLKKLPFNENMVAVFSSVYMQARMLCKDILIAYSHFMEKDFFTNVPKERRTSVSEMLELQRQRERQGRK